MKQSIRTFALYLAVTTIALLLVSPVSWAAPDPGLIFHWDLNEGSGTATLDKSGNNYDGVIYNGGAYVTGHEGKGVLLNGIDQYIQTPSPFGFLGTVNQPYALSAWVNLPQAGTSGNIFHISSAMDGSGWCIPFLTLTNGHFTATGWSATNGGQTTALDPTAAVSNHWYQVITTWDTADGLRLFVDGVLVASTPQADYDASGSPMYASLGLGAGSCSNDQGYLAGTVDDARIYSRVLTSTDVQTIASEGTPAQPNVQSTPTATQPSTSATITASPQISAPDTGYGAPGRSSKTAAIIVLISAVAVVGIGLSLRRYSKIRIR